MKGIFNHRSIQKAKMMRLFFVLLSLTSIITESTGYRSYFGCHSFNQSAFNLTCNENELIWIRSAYFGQRDRQDSTFCNKTLPDSTHDCIPDRNLTTRNLRLACNTIRGGCMPNGPGETMTQAMFKNCSIQGFTYAYAEYDCLPANDSNGTYNDHVFFGSGDFNRSFSEKVYLMSANYDLKGYTDSPISQCSVTVPSDTRLDFRVLDLRVQTNVDPAIFCPYKLSLDSGTGYSKQWCAQLDYSGDEYYSIPQSANGLTVNVVFSSSQGSSALQGRVWILVNASKGDDTSATIIISCGLITSNTTTTTTTTPSTTSSTTSTTTPTTTTTTTSTTTPTTTSTTTTATTPLTTSTTTPTTPTTTTTTTTPTTTLTYTTTTTTLSTTRTTTTTPTSSTSSTTSSPPTTSSTTTFPSTTLTRLLTPSATASTSTTGPTTTSTTLSTIRSARTTPTTTILAIPSATGSTPTTTTTMTTPGVEPPSFSSPDYTEMENSSASTSSGEMRNEISPGKTVGIAIGVSVAGVFVLCVVASVTICVCMAYQKRKKQRWPSSSSSTVKDLSPAPVSQQQDVPLRSYSSTTANQGALSPGGVASTTENRSGEGVYSVIEDATIGRTGAAKPNGEAASVEHQLSVVYTVVSPTKSAGDKPKKYKPNKRIKGRPSQLDELSESPPAYSDGTQAAGNAKRSKSKILIKLYIPPGDNGESDTDIQQNPVYDDDDQQED